MLMLPDISAIPRCHWLGAHSGGWAGNAWTDPPKHLLCGWCHLHFPNPYYQDGSARIDGTKT